ncbi:uncharacterized protein PAC_06521 [Phialocephala subalpina]|uniref:N-acetyltransferase domain-containing protein n=1 Tax=Phialocephala subalpina TaxID=576137 RepID=A0A1L7WV32_9HELO|nr:uncharacterized protein PAC_06521 [Phialocephala subalpina]
MESAGRRSKRKAEAISPTRDSDSVLTSSHKDRKRRDTTNIHDSPPSADRNDLAADSNIAHEKANQDTSETEDEEDEENAEDSLDFEDEDEENSEDELDDSEDKMYGQYFDDDEDMGPPECEVEEKEYYFGGSQEFKLIFKAYLQEDDDEFERWMKTIHVSCSYDGKEIGRGFGRYVDRDRIRHTFWRDMEEPCEELSKVAFDLFDRHGRLKQELRDHTIRKGTGVWGSELDIGPLFFIEEVCVDRDWRRKGVGKRIVTSLIEKSRAGRRAPEFLLVGPGWLSREIEPDTQGKTKLEEQQIQIRVRGVAISLYRSLGFRRIGASSFFGLATDPTHPAHTIPSGADFDPTDPEPDFEGPETQLVEDWFGDPARSSWRLKLLQERLPLQHAAFTLPDGECVEFFNKFKISNMSMDDWGKVDRFSKNALHVAACEFKVQSVRWLLENANEGQTLSLARTTEGYTPQEELESQLESKRTRREHGMLTVDISNNFLGFPSEAIGCLAALRAVNNPSELEYARMKFGCTCGSCIDGFLSPRMKFALLCEAEVTHDMLKDGVEDGEMWSVIHDDLFTHVARDIQQNFRTNKSYRQGFANVFGHAAVTLQADKAPTILNVQNTVRDSNEWPPHTRNFFQRGGNTESALRIIFEQARDQDEWVGDGMHMDVFENGINALPECRNDHEFGFVASVCGISDLTRLYG